MEEELRAALTLARLAGERIMRLYGEAEPREKSDGSPVTQADIEASALIVEGLAKRFPADGFLTEEAQDDGSRLSKKRVWIIDPLDGTKEFIKRNGEFTVNIALVVHGRPLLGVIFLPARDECFYASPAGAFRDWGGSTEPLSVSARSRFEEMVLVVSRSHLSSEDKQLSERCGFARVERAGSSLKGCWVASGRADVYVRAGTVNEWDICAMDCIVHAAGGRLTSFTGERFKYNCDDPRIHGFLASNGARHEDLLRLCNGPARQT